MKKCLNTIDLYDIIYRIILGEKEMSILEENLREISSKNLIEMYVKNKEMLEFLDKEYKRVRGSDE